MAHCQGVGANGRYRELAELLGEDAVREIRFQTDGLIGRHGFKRCDRDGLEAEFALRVWQDLRNYQPEKSSRRHFISEVIRRKAIELIRYQEAEKRSFRKEEFSLDAPLANGRPDLRDTLAAPDAEKSRDCALDVKAAIPLLPAHLQTLCELLMKHLPAEAIRETGLTRAVLRGQMKQIREVFQKKKLDDYLPEKRQPKPKTPA